MRNLYAFLKANEGHRDHPVLGAVLYDFCPTAAGWWKSGVTLPKAEPYDVVEHVLRTYAQGVLLKNALQSYGLESLYDSVKKYVEDVKSYRRHLPGALAPELLPSFNRTSIETTLRFGNNNAFRDHFGGEWRNVLEFARVWAFILQDWLEAVAPMVEGRFKLQSKELAFRLSNAGFSVVLPSWVWIKDGGRRPCIGVVSDGLVCNQIELFMSMYSAPSPDKTWDMMPQVFVMEPRTGEVKSAESLVDRRLMIDLMDEYGKRAAQGPYLPRGAMAGGGECRRCLFCSYCFEPSGILSDFVWLLIKPDERKNVAARQEMFVK